MATKRQIRILKEELLPIIEQKDVVRPLNIAKWRGELRIIRNTLIKLRDKAEDENDRIDDAIRDEDMSQQENDRLATLSEHLTECVDAIAEAINQIDACL